ncbi:MAG: TIGR04222 domain-containing membrane protein [Methylococcaceae bacterium]|nr:TIGR04222 domain-containing membrane protein [Methylococcaceae bacterium]
MNLQQQALYQRLQAYSLDAPEACFSFSQRLARENGWSLAYTHGVIDEYKKFAFLAMVAGHTVSPSAAVDQAWHLHLTYTRSYWNEFCQGILGKPLHHEPSRGGHAEQRRYRQLYQQTLASYERIFAEPPPAEFWPSPEQRFDKAAHYVRVNRQHLWLLPKLRPPRKAMLLLLSVVGVMAGLMTGCSVLQPFDNVLKAWMSAGIGSFLIVNIAFSALLMMLGSKWLVSIRCATPPSALKLNNLELAYLTGGADRVFQTAIVAMVERGDLTVLTQDDDNGKILKFTLARGFKARSEFEQALANKMTAGRFNIKQWYRFAGDLAQAIRQQLVRKKLLIATPVWVMRCILLFSPLILLDLARLMDVGVIEAFLGLPIEWRLVGFIGLIGFTIVKAISRALCANPQSSYGDQVLAYYQKIQANAPITTVVAITGLSGLEATAYADLAEAIRIPASVNQNGDSAGGGCGGCGGG